MKHLETVVPLWEHQKIGIEEALKKDAFALFWEMGTGKTNATVQILRHRYRAVKKVLPTLILCPIIVVENWRREIEANAGSAVIQAVQCLTGTAKNRRKQLATPGKQIFITNIDVIPTKLWSEISKRSWDFLVIDECFVGETEVSTLEGPKRIDSIKVGDTVLNANGDGVVEHVFVRESNNLLRVEFSNGTKFICTENHPICTLEGWKTAKELVNDEILISEKGLCCLLDGVLAVDKGSQYLRRECLEQAKILLSLLREEAREPDAQGSGSEKSIESFERNWIRTYSAWRERTRASLAAAETFEGTWTGMGSRSFCPYEDETSWNWLSDLLQNRHCSLEEKNRDRGGRRESFFSASEKERQEKIIASRFPRVVRVSCIESKSSRTVFNLQVSGHPSYFADGKLVHNCHKFKDPTSKRTTAIIKLADKVKNKLILTGSPILNSEMDIWGEFRILSPNIFPENFYVFRQQYFEDKNSRMPKHKHFPAWVPKPGTREALRQIISEHSMRVKKSEVLDLPELVRQTVFVDLTPEQRRLYSEMEEAFITYLDGSACVAEIALTKMLRLQQLAVGIVKTETGEVKRVETEKLKALSELLEDLCPQHKVIVWTNFVDTYEDIRLLCKKRKLKFVEIIGSQNAKQRQAGVDAFNTDPSVSVCIANQQAGGVGIGLQAASYAVYYSKTFSLEHDQQSESRNHRGGSEIHEKITRVDIVIRGTIDEEITAALRSKTQLSEFLLALRNKGRQIENQKEAVTDALEIFTGEQA